MKAIPLSSAIISAMWTAFVLGSIFPVVFVSKREVKKLAG